MGQLTIDPRIGRDSSAFGKLEFGQGSLHSLVLQSILLDHHDLLVVARPVHVGPQTDIALNFASGQVDHGLMKAFLLES